MSSFWHTWGRDWNYKTHFAQEKCSIYWDWREWNRGPNCRRKLLQYLRIHVLSPDHRPSFPQMRMWVPLSLCPFEQRMWHSAPGGYLIPGVCPGQRTSLCSGSTRGSQPASLSAKSVKSHTILWNSYCVQNLRTKKHTWEILWWPVLW